MVRSFAAICGVLLALVAQNVIGQGKLSGSATARNEIAVGATITIQQYTSDIIELRNFPIRSAKTDANGSWSFDNVKAGKYRIKAIPPPMRSSDRRRALSEVAFILDVPPSDKTHTIEFPLMSTVSGQFRDNSGELLQTEFHLIATDEAKGIVSGAEVKTGNFTIKNLSQGTYKFNVASDDGYYIEDIKLKGLSLRDASFDLDDGIDMKDFVIVMSKVKGTLQGRVIGLPATEFRLVVLVPFTFSAKESLRSSNPVATEEGGIFEISDKPGEYFVVVLDSATLRERTPDNAEEWFTKVTKTAPRIVLKADEVTNVDIRQN